MRFESDDLTSELGAAAVQGSVQEKLVRAYELAGIRPGACTFAFGRDGRFTATAGSRTLAGTYAFDAATHEIVLDIERKSGRTLSVPGHAYLSGSGLQLVFPVTKLVETIEAFGSRRSKKPPRCSNATATSTSGSSSTATDGRIRRNVGTSERRNRHRAPPGEAPPRRTPAPHTDRPTDRTRRTPVLYTAYRTVRTRRHLSFPRLAKISLYSVIWAS